MLPKSSTFRTAELIHRHGTGVVVVVRVVVTEVDRVAVVALEAV